MAQLEVTSKRARPLYLCKMPGSGLALDSSRGSLTKPGVLLASAAPGKTWSRRGSLGLPISMRERNGAGTLTGKFFNNGWSAGRASCFRFSRRQSSSVFLIVPARISCQLLSFVVGISAGCVKNYTLVNWFCMHQEWPE